MMQRVTLAGLAALTVLTPLAAQTQELFDDRFYITPFGSYTISDHARKADNGWGGGLTIGRPINPYFNLELYGSYEKLDSRSNDPGNNYKIWDTGVNALFFFRREGFQPFLLAGVGAIRDDVYGSYGYQNKQAWSFMANGGVGFLVPVADWLQLRADGRYRWDANNGNIRNQGSFGDWVITAGLQIPLGEKPRASVAAPMPVVLQPPVTRTFELSADTLFAFNQATLLPQGIAELDRFTQELRGAAFSSILVVGHTDPFGSDAYNMRLSDRRANTVMNYLISRGVPADLIRAEGRGKTQLKVTPADCAAAGARTRPALIQCYQPDRRVAVTVTTKAQQ